MGAGAGGAGLGAGAGAGLGAGAGSQGALATTPPALDSMISSSQLSKSRSVEGALNHLLDALRRFGFSKPVTMKDATRLGRVERYEFSL